MTGEKGDYYNLLVHGFREGHLYMKVAVDPRLLSPDPGVRRYADYLLDATLYKGRYYLYFGVVPAALLFLPYRELTGQDLPVNAAVLLMIVAGFLLYLHLYLGARRRYFPSLSCWMHAGCIALLAFGSGTESLLIGSGVYEVPIAGGYLCMAMMWHGMFWCWQADRKSCRWLALASLGFGLAVGCRPNCLFCLPILLVLAALVIRRTERDKHPVSTLRLRLRFISAAIIPAGLVGLGLMTYNYCRFGSPFEFGFTAAFHTGKPWAKLSFVWPNVKWYFLRPPVFSPYFPFVFPMNALDRPPDYYGYEPIQGQMPAFLLALLIGAGLLAVWRRDRSLPRAFWIFIALVAGGFLCLFLPEASFGFRANRYVPDFQGTFVLLLVLAGGYCGSLLGQRPSRKWAMAWRAIFVMLTATSAICDFLTSLEISYRFESSRPGSYRFLAYYGSYPSYFLWKLGFFHYGPVHFKVTFNSVSTAARSPLLATGIPGYSDVLYSVQYPNGLVQLSIHHDGYGGYGSEMIPIQIGRPYDVEVDMGSLYPPRIDPWFRGYTAAKVETYKTTVRIQFDGKVVIHGRLGFYDAPPTWVHFGENPANIEPPFSGKISSIALLPPRDFESLSLFDEIGIWRLQFEAPSPTAVYRYPMLASGVPGHGNLLLMEILPDRKFRFDIDQWGSGLSSSPTFTELKSGQHLLEIFAGPQVALHSFPPGSGINSGKVSSSSSRFNVWLDGVLVWTTSIESHRDSYGWVAIGSNPQGFSSAGSFFPTPVVSKPYSTQEMNAFVAENIEEL